MKKRHTGLRSEILVTLAILLGSSLLLGGFLFLRYTEQNLVQQRIQMASLGLRLAASAFSQKDLRQQGDNTDIFFELQQKLNAQSWWLYDRDLQVQFSYQSTDEGRLPLAQLRRTLLQGDEFIQLNWPGLFAFLSPDKDCSLLIALPVGRSSRPQAVLAARFSLRDIFDQLGQAQRWLLAYVFAYGSVLVGAGYFLIHRNVVRPTRQLLEATQAIAAGNLNLKLEKSGPHEIYALAQSFNLMVDALSRSQAETQAHIESLRKANIETMQAQRELIRSEKLASVGYLAAGMAHEIGNPLGALIGYLSLLQKDLIQSDQQEILSAAGNAAERIDRLVKELLDYAKPNDSGIEELDPWGVVKDSIQMLERQGVFKNGPVSYNPEQVLPRVRMDRHQLEQVMVNLLLNSRDACENGGEISVQGIVEDMWVKVSVKDTGSGIAPQHLAHIFEPFFTTKDPGKGTGLGLAVCQRIMTEAGGEITCESTLGVGSVFHLHFPRIKSFS